MKAKRHLLAISALMASSFFIAPAASHESRVVGKNPTDKVNLKATGVNVHVTVGFLAEPAFEDSYNGLDLFLFTYDGACPIDTSDYFGNPIDPNNGDTVTLKAEAIYFQKSVPPTGRTGNLAPSNILKRLVISDKSAVSEKYGDPGHYNSYYRPTHPGNPELGGAYGFHVYGTVTTKDSTYTCDADTKTPTTKTIKGRTAHLDQYWVCEAGFRVPPGGPASPLGQAQFNCIDPVQVFPGNPGDGYQPNKAYTGH